jgi:hypothetical protein
MTLVAPCRGIRSYETLRAAQEAAHKDPNGNIPYRCTTCSWWHVPGPEIRDGRHRFRVVGA